MSKYSNVEAILAIDEKNGLAKNGEIPWKNKTDMRFFREKTMNNIVVMGVKTLLSLPNSQPLKNRYNFIITSEPVKYYELYKKSEEVIMFVGLECIISLLEDDKLKDKKIFIIGGKQLYEKLLPYCSTIWLTRIRKDYDCDLILDYDLSKYNKEILYEDNDIQIMNLS